MATRSPVKLEITTDQVAAGLWKAELLVNDQPVIDFDAPTEIEAFRLAERRVAEALVQL